MNQATNIPYVKQYDEQGLLIKIGTIRNDGSNRANRRKGKVRPFNNTNHKTVTTHKVSEVEVVKVRHEYQFIKGKKIVHFLMSK